MIAALIILAALVVAGAVLYFFHRRDEARVESYIEEPPEIGENAECCGMHITCEKDSLLSSVSPEIEYYDDEELDRYAGTGADDYSDEAIEEFRGVLLTLLPHDIAGWARSIQLRGITLPSPVREELLLIVSEARAAATAHNNA
ncbi:MAG: phospholipase [Paramuribaculum sp.]|nr:phospholipase [Paramuribaculum sp.]